MFPFAYFRNIRICITTHATSLSTSTQTHRFSRLLPPIIRFNPPSTHLESHPSTRTVDALSLALIICSTNDQVLLQCTILHLQTPTTHTHPAHTHLFHHPPTHNTCEPTTLNAPKGTTFPIEDVCFDISKASHRDGELAARPSIISSV